MAVYDISLIDTSINYTHGYIRSILSEIIHSILMLFLKSKGVFFIYVQKTSYSVFCLFVFSNTDTL